MTRGTTPTLSTSRPVLPLAQSILPFLEEIDANRWYTNFGPLVRRFEAELGKHAEAATNTVVTASSATAGITLALREVVGGRAGLCILPSWTFIATPIAVRNAGLTPLFVDVDPRTWQITLDIAHAAVRRHGDAIRAIAVVAPFSAKVDIAAWSAFTDETGLPVIIDAASAFDVARANPDLVSVVSLHATKALGIGEGAFILAGDPCRADRLRRMSNFGMNADRLSFLQGGDNAKLSEYAAAVGLAALRDWPKRRHALLDRAARMRDAIESGTRLVCASDPHIASSTFNVVTRKGRADALIDWLGRCGLEARKWWADGCHSHPAFQSCPREDLTATETLAARVVGLPFFADMSLDEIETIAECIAQFERGDRNNPSWNDDLAGIGGS